MDDLSVDSDDSDPLGRVVSFMEEATPRANGNTNSKFALEINSDDGDGPDSATSPIPSPRKSMVDTIRKSFQKFTNVRLDEDDEDEQEEGEGENHNEEDEEDEKPRSSFFFCCS